MNWSWAVGRHSWLGLHIGERLARLIFARIQRPRGIPSIVTWRSCVLRVGASVARSAARTQLVEPAEVVAAAIVDGDRSAETRWWRRGTLGRRGWWRGRGRRWRWRGCSRRRWQGVFEARKRAPLLRWVRARVGLVAAAHARSTRPVGVQVGFGSRCGAMGNVDRHAAIDARARHVATDRVRMRWRWRRRTRWDVVQPHVAGVLLLDGPGWVPATVECVDALLFLRGGARAGAVGSWQNRGVARRVRWVGWRQRR